MIHQALGRPLPVELTDDRRIRRRVARLAAVSAVALGLISALAILTLETPGWLEALLLLGWLLMPTTLVISLSRPRLRYALVVPASLVSLALLSVVVAWSPGGVAGVGWLLMLLGVLLGGAMGAWLWFRLLPVPAALDAPEAPARWALIAAHVALIVTGWLLAATLLLG